jgi:hypothetical protein
MKRTLLITVLAAAVFALLALPAGAGNNSGSCSISPNPAAVNSDYVVSAQGIPTKGAVNLFITDPNGNVVGRPLGSAPLGTFNIVESSPFAGLWTYEFQGPTRGGNGTQIYATCTVQVN